MTPRPLHAIALVAVLAAGAYAALWRAYPHRIEPVRGSNAVGDATCLGCHGDKTAFERAAHHLTSQRPARESIGGSFAPGENVLRTRNPFLYFRMDSSASGFRQTAVSGRSPDTTTRTERIDYVIGSGRKGQSYLYWANGDHLNQLPVSFWRGLGWINSPGYRDGSADFSRPVPPRCLECHASGFEPASDRSGENRYRTTSGLLGITCETCHGAGREHVRRQRAPRLVRAVLRTALPRATVNPATLPRARQLDLCALCHGGAAPDRTPAFTFVPGQPLEQHLQAQYVLPTDDVDVHGNQVALLERSRCFQSSQMTCATCHDVHRPQRDLTALSGRCLSCHTVQSCGLFPTRGQALLGRCVDCHMPTRPSNTIVSDYQGHLEHPRVRTHLIKVYPQDTSS